jgi:hypothetical protein
VEDKLQIAQNCRSCGKRIVLNVPAEGFRKWQQGAMIQNVLPKLSPGEREFLMSGICEPCFDNIFGEDDWDE